MSTSFSFNGQTIKIPGVYSQIKSGIKNPPVALPFGNLLVIDTGSGASYGGGAGVDGELAQGKNSIYEFDNIADFQDFAKGGLWWLLAQPLFRPAGLAANGISKIFFIKAATTTAAEIDYTFFGDGGSSLSQSIGNIVNGGTLNIKVTDEGLIGNGELDANSNLIKGYAAKMSAGKIDTSKFVLTFYRGTYKGLDQNNLPYDGIEDVDSTPIVVAKSPEFNNIQTLIDWMLTSATFKKYFLLASYAVTGDGTVDSDDLAHNSDYTLATGGTESYAASTLIDDAISAIEDLQVNFVLSDKSGASAISTVNDKLVEYATVTSKWNPELYIAAGDDVDTFADSLAVCENYDNDSVSVVHGAIYKQSLQGLRTYSSMFKASAFLGREAGLEPQVPITFKNIDIDGEVHKLSDKEVTQALDAGLLVSRLDDGSFDIVKGINSLQANDFLINDNGTTASKQIKRITRQLNNGIRVNAKKQLLKQPNGVNRNTLSTTDVEVWVAKYLKQQIALPDSDNLILRFQDIVVTRNQDAYSISYKFVPNGEISFLFFTGLLLDI